MEKAHEPIFSIPPVMLGLVACLCIIQGMMAYVLPVEVSDTLLDLFAFEPLRYYAPGLQDGSLPGGLAAAIWTFVTYAFFHINWSHLIFNLVWLLAFGTPLARRFGTWRFLAFFAFTAATGALAHLVTHLGEDRPAIGASAAVIGMMAGAMRFVFQRGGPSGFLRLSEAQTYRVPAKSLVEMVRDRRMLVIALVWVGSSALTGLPFFSMLGNDVIVTWQAHIGGFLGGLLAFSAFDPVPAAPATEDAPGPRPIDDEAASS